ncbi:MAG: hypothetical protein DPW09_38445 [Anaerolineae bacterium]|nr:hypothetical protein [Anaerolineae bacterium]
MIPAGAFEEENGLVTMEAENFGARINGATHNWLLKTGQSGYTGTSYLQPLPDVDTLYSTETLTDSPRAEYPINFTTPGTYTVWARGYPTNAAGDSLHVGLSGQVVEVSGFVPGKWEWANERMANGESANLIVSAPGPYTLTVWMREDGLRLDRILLITDTAYIPTGFGPAESERASGGQAFVGPASSVQQALVVGGLEGWKVGRLEDRSQLSSIYYPPSSNLARSPFGQDPTLLLMGPLAAAAPLAGRHKWRRSAWLILLILLVLGLMATGTAIAADVTADGRPPTAGMTGDRRPETGVYSTDHAPRTTPYAIPNLQSPISTGALTTTYTYDPLYRLTGATDNEGGSFAYSYDSAGNRLSYTVNNTQVATYTYNAANWLTQIVNRQSEIVNYSYDDNGNLLNDGLFSYTYDSANRLTQVVSGTLTTAYVYNGDGVRVAQIQDGVRTDYVQDVAASLPQVLISQQGSATTKYLRGLGLIGAQQGTNAFQFYLSDTLGSVRQVVNAQGQVELTRRYDPFGGLQSEVGIGRSAYGFAGEEQDPESGQLFLRARTYNPGTGRFLQADPVMGALNDPRMLHHYAYAFNNPVNYTDSSGLMPLTLQRPREQQPQHSALQKLISSYSNYSVDAATQVGYMGGAGRSGFNRAYLGQAGQASSIGAQRAATGPEAQNWQPHSDPQPREQSQGKRPKACGFTNILFGLGNSALKGNLLNDAFELSMHSPPALRQWMAQHQTLLRVLAGAAIIGGALVLTGGAALAPILLGAGLGAGIGYGAQVWNNYQQGQNGWDAWINHINWGSVGWAAFHGAVAGAAAEIIAPLLPSGGVGVTGMLESAFANVISGRVSQVALNVMNGQAWDEGLDDPQSIAIDVLAGVGAAALHTWQAGKAAAKAAEAETAAKTAKALGEGVEESRLVSSVDEAADNPLQRLDDLMSDRPASNMSKEELRQVLADSSDPGALNQRLETQNGLNNLSESTNSNQALKQGNLENAHFRESILSSENLPGFTPEESRYIRDALNNDARNLRGGEFEPVCFDAARCLNKFTPIHDDLADAREVGQFTSKLDSSTFTLVGELKNTISVHQLEPGDFLIYYWRNYGGEGVVHANRFLGFADGTPLFFDKWGHDPFAIRDLAQVQAEGKNDLAPIFVFRRQ